MCYKIEIFISKCFPIGYPQVVLDQGNAYVNCQQGTSTTDTSAAVNQDWTSVVNNVHKTDELQSSQKCIVALIIVSLISLKRQTVQTSTHFLAYLF